MMIKKAVCLLLLNPQNEILVVARRGTTDKWGLPGGKVDPGEDSLQALIREVQEETFLYKGILNQVPKQGDAGPVKFVSWDELLSGAFCKYNLALRGVLNENMKTIVFLH